MTGRILMSLARVSTRGYTGCSEKRAFRTRALSGLVMAVFQGTLCMGLFLRGRAGTHTLLVGAGKLWAPSDKEGLFLRNCLPISWLAFSEKLPGFGFVIVWRELFTM